MSAYEEGALLSVDVFSGFFLAIRTFAETLRSCKICCVVKVTFSITGFTYTVKGSTYGYDFAGRLALV